MGRAKYLLAATAITFGNVFVASLVGLMMGGLSGLAGGVLAGVCISVPMLPRRR